MLPREITKHSASQEELLEERRDDESIHRAERQGRIDEWLTAQPPRNDDGEREGAAAAGTPRE